jgi:transposase-like protein
MITQVLHCPYCQGIDIVRHGTTPEDKQRYRCRDCQLGRGRTFLLNYTYAGQAPGVKQQMVDMAMNASAPSRLKRWIAEPLYWQQSKKLALILSINLGAREH